MFAKPNRLNARAVKRLYAKGRRYIKPTIFLFVLPNQAKVSRFAVVCGKKVSPLAVKRNRLKRIVRATILATPLTNLPLADYLVVLRPAAAATESILKEDVAALVAEVKRRL